jgi:hypothetical protein
MLEALEKLTIDYSGRAGTTIQATFWVARPSNVSTSLFESNFAQSDLQLYPR